MAKDKKTASVELTVVSPKKHSVRFDSEEKDPLISSVYINRTQAKKLLGVDLEKAEDGVKITIEVL